jgi:tryptophan-rich sensory protein
VKSKLLVTCKGPRFVYVCSLLGGSVSVRFYRPRLLDSIGYLVVFLSLQSFPLFHKMTWALPNVWLLVFACASISCWMKPFRGQLC